MIRQLGILGFSLVLASGMGARSATPEPDPALAPPIRISPEGARAVHFYFQQCPESPDGKRVVYTVFGKRGAAEAYISDRDGGNARSVGSVAHAQRHTGADTTWIDNQRVAFCDAKLHQVHIVNVDTGDTRITTGGIEQYSPENGKIVFCSRGGALPMGIYSLGVESGECKTLIDLETVRPFAKDMDKPYDPKLWKLDHPYWSPNGKRIEFVIKAEGWKPKTKPHAFVFYCNADGSDIRYISPKPMHVQWWDNDSIFGHDDWDAVDKNLRRWDLDGKMVEHVAGYGCHGAVSPDKQWIVTESWYSSDPIVLRLYRRGQTSGGRVLYVQPGTVDGENFWKLRAHMHPAFSRDGKRVYFNAIPPNAGGSKVFALDLTPLIGDSSK